MEKNICQRCKLAMRQLADFGSNLDGTVNTEYCRSCYIKGTYRESGIFLSKNIRKKNRSVLKEPI